MSYADDANNEETEVALGGQKLGFAPTLVSSWSLETCVCRDCSGLGFQEINPSRNTWRIVIGQIGISYCTVFDLQYRFTRSKT